MEIAGYEELNQHLSRKLFLYGADVERLAGKEHVYFGKNRKREKEQRLWCMQTD